MENSIEKFLSRIWQKLESNFLQEKKNLILKHEDTTFSLKEKITFLQNALKNQLDRYLPKQTIQQKKFKLG